MEADEILTRVKEDANLPQDWVVFPLLRGKVMQGLAGWAFGIIIGVVLFVAVSTVVIPVNYTRGFLPALLTTILLGVFLFIAIGSAWILISDIRRLRQKDKHMIVITPEDFVKQEGDKIMHVPLINVRHVTARGLPPPDLVDEVNDARRIPSSGERMLNFFTGARSSNARLRRKRMRTPTSLAFVDTRNDHEVMVVEDASYGDPHAIAGVLRDYAGAIQQLVR